MLTMVKVTKWCRGGNVGDGGGCGVVVVVGGVGGCGSGIDGDGGGCGGERSRILQDNKLIMLII